MFPIPTTPEDLERFTVQKVGQRMPEVFIGLDLAQVSDFTAISVIEPRSRHLLLRHLERFKNTSYPNVIQRVESLVKSAPLEPFRSYVVVDNTGTGRAVTDLLRERIYDTIAITITAGQNAQQKDPLNWYVPKKDLIVGLLVLAQNQQLKVAADLHLAETFSKELQSMRAIINARTIHTKYNADAGEHDDLVMSVSLACWFATNRPPPPIPPLRFVH